MLCHTALIATILNASSPAPQRRAHLLLHPAPRPRVGLADVLQPGAGLPVLLVRLAGRLVQPDEVEVVDLVGAEGLGTREGCVWRGRLVQVACAACCMPV